MRRRGEAQAGSLNPSRAGGVMPGGLSLLVPVTGQHRSSAFSTHLTSLEHRWFAVSENFWASFLSNDIQSAGFLPELL